MSVGGIAERVIAGPFVWHQSMEVDAVSPARFRIPRFALLAALVCAALIAAPAVARADDLIQLSGDPPVTLSGGVGYGLLYLDGAVRLGGDTSITAKDVFIGPDASLSTCYDIGSNGNNCTSGRSLTINASGGVAISPAIDLRGLIGANRAGGTLVIRAARVSLGGAVDTSGTDAPSGAIVIDSPGFVVTQTLRAPGAGISVRGAAGVLIGGDVWSAGSDAATGGDPSRLTSGGGVQVASSAGDVSILGAVASWGRDVPGAGAIEGGHGGAVGVSGGDVRISGGVDASAGRGVDTSAGKPGPISLAARAGLVVSGAVTSSGDIATNGYGSSAAPISMTAAGSLVAASIAAMGGASTNLGAGFGASVTLSAGASLSAGSITTSGASSAFGGTRGGTVSVSAQSVALGAVTADAGDATSDAAGGSGDNGGPVTIKAAGPAAVGAVSTRGGSGRTTGLGGAGGSVTISGDRVITGSITTLGENLSAAGGIVTLVSQTALLVGGAIDTSGGAGANGNPARQGGSGGSMALIAARGPLTLGGRLRSEGGAGGSGGAQGASGGNSGAIELVVQSIAASTGVLSGGGNGGASGVAGGPRGKGGDGGRVRVWAQAPSLMLLNLVDSTGGAGDPNGADGAQQDESAPTGLAISKTGMLSFVPHAPEADGYRVFASLAGAPAKAVMSTTKTSGVALPKVPPCVKADYTLSGYHSGVGWQSDPIGPVSVMLPPSANQACTDAPQVTLGVQKLKKKIPGLRKKKWRVPVRFLSDGMGMVRVVLSRKKTKLATVDKPLGAVRRNVSVTLTIPTKLRKAGKFTVTVTGSAPIGKARSKSTLTLEVKK
jgi:hypothetical protein